MEKTIVDQIIYNIYEKVAFLQSVGSCQKEEIVIPSTIKVAGKDYTVARILESAFMDCNTVKVVRIPDSVKWIERNAFVGCVNLEKVRISNGVNTIADYAFCGCEKLRKITLPSKLTVLGEGVFIGCSSLEEISLPKALISIGNSAFLGSGIKEISTTNSIQIIEDFAFKGCKNLKSIKISSSVRAIGEHSFSGCSSLSSISVSEDNSVFESHSGILYSKGCTTLLLCPANKSGSISVDSKTTEISSHAFEDCMRLNKIKLPKNLIKIEKEAFAWNEEFLYKDAKNDEQKDYGIKSIVIPDTVITIGDEAFRDVTTLDGIFIPKNVRNIGNKAFKGCTSLKIFYEGEVIPMTWDSAFNPDGCEVILNANLAQFKKAVEEE